MADEISALFWKQRDPKLTPRASIIVGYLLNNP